MKNVVIGITALLLALSSLAFAENMDGKKLVLFDTDRIERGGLEAFYSIDALGTNVDQARGPQPILRGEKVFIPVSEDALVSSACRYDGSDCMARNLKIYARFSPQEEFKLIYSGLPYYYGSYYLGRSFIPVSLPANAEKFEVYASVEKAICLDRTTDSEGHEDCFGGYRPIGMGYISNFGRNFSMTVR